MSKKLNDLDKLARALAEELKNIKNPHLALERAKARIAEGEPSGFSGPAKRTDEVTFTEDGRPILLFHKGINYPKDDSMLEKKGYSGLYDTAFQPSIPDSPNVDLFTNLRRINEKRPTEGSYLNRIEKLVTARNLFFKDVLSTVKSIYPDMKMQFPEPPTYIWNPKNKEDKLDIQGIKNKLKIRFPELEWFNRTLDGVPTAQMEFMDGSACDFTIGDQANHLTLTYWKKDPNKQVDPIKDGN